MIAQINGFFKQYFDNWAQSRTHLGFAQELGARNTYILPSSFGWAYGFVLLTIITGAINYQINTAFLFFFLLLIVGFLSMWETHRNLKGVIIHHLPIEDTEEGQSARITIQLSSKSNAKFGLIICFEGGNPTFLELLPKEGAQIELPYPTSKRGGFKLPRITLYSYFPIGLFCAWGYAYFDTTFYVYPKAISPGFWPQNHYGKEQMQQPIHTSGEDELYELKSINNPWIQPSRIAWKTSARGQGWFLKKLTSPVGETWLFRIEDLSGTDTELNLQQLSYWIQLAEEMHHSYGLELKGIRTDMSHGKHHMQHCLRQLATY